MKRLLHIACAMLALALSSSCTTTEYYEPVFGLEDLPEVIPADGGVYSVAYDFLYYPTKGTRIEEFEFEYRIVIGKEVIFQDVKKPGSNTIKVGIPSNLDRYSKPVIVEASTHVFTYTEDWWGDWTPICSAVQLGR